MLTWSIICMFLATIILSIGYCLAPSKAWSFVFQILCLISLFCFGIALANFTTGFGIYSILLIVAVAPQFLNLYNPNKSKQKTEEHEKNTEVDVVETEIDQNEENLEIQNETDLETKPKKLAKAPKIYCNLTNSISIFATAFILGFCGFYWGLEVAYGYLIGLFFAGATTLLMLALKKKFKLTDLLSMFFCLLSAGIAIGQIILVLLYSLEVANLIYCLSSLLFACFALFACFKQFKLNNMIFYFSTLCFFSTLIFYAQIF